MTSLCPAYLPETCQSLFTRMDRLAARWQPLAPAHCHLSILDLHLLTPLTEQTETLAFLTTLLSPAEVGMFQRFSYAKRRLEWLGGRLAAKHCLHKLSHTSPADPLAYGDYSLLPDINGRPRLAQPLAQHAAACISISHSHQYAAAMVHQQGDCGIDIQQKTPKLATVQERFATKEELHLFQPAPDQLTRLGLLWTIKEAVKKCLLADHPSFFGTIRLTEVQYTVAKGTWTVQCLLTNPSAMTATVRAADLGDYLVACAAGGPHA